MKIGTLTLHLPFNYGNALQMLSLHRYLREQGYDAEVLSHWFWKDRAEVEYWHRACRTWKGRIRFALNALLFSGVVCQFRRETKMMRWLAEKIRWSDERGVTGEFDPNRLPHDVIVSGSDQVWNPEHATSDFFLLPDFPDRMRKIAYAASLGTDRFPDARKPFFSRCLARFSAIGLRESSGVRIVRDGLGRPATLVCDPTLLHTKEEWCRLLGFELPKESGRDLVCYFVTPDYLSEASTVLRLARESGRRIHCFAFVYSQSLATFDCRHPLSMLRRSLGLLARRVRLYRAGVRLHFSATPDEFVRCLAQSDGLFTDSFHGLMFATIFGKRCNVTIGRHAERLQMSARLRDFTRDFGRPDILTPAADLSALREVSVTPALRELIDSSKRWLKNALEEDSTHA